MACVTNKIAKTRFCQVDDKGLDGNKQNIIVCYKKQLPTEHLLLFTSINVNIDKLAANLLVLVL